VFGKETRGLPDELIEKNMETAIRIPILPDARSLNLSNAVAVVVFEALRQMDFPSLT
jgi:tRNA (cytidine/uridine-2'-O-)-methyltransferase